VRLALLLATLLTGCGPAEPCAGWHDALDGDAGLQLTAAEHGPGWGETACFLCHQAWTIHPPECLEDGWLEHLDEAVDYDDTESCTSCHGANGTRDEDWVDTTTSAS
jgi:hypothetical protein